MERAITTPEMFPASVVAGGAGRIDGAVAGASGVREPDNMRCFFAGGGGIDSMLGRAGLFGAPEGRKERLACAFREEVVDTVESVGGIALPVDMVETDW